MVALRTDYQDNNEAAKFVAKKSPRDSGVPCGLSVFLPAGAG